MQKNNRYEKLTFKDVCEAVDDILLRLERIERDLAALKRNAC